MNANLTLRERHRAIGAILEARYSVHAYEEVRRQNAEFWDSPRNDIAPSSSPDNNSGRTPCSSHISASRAVFAKIDAAEMARTLASPPTMARQGSDTGGS